MTIEEYINIYKACGHKIMFFCGHYFKPRKFLNYSFPLDYKISVSGKMVNSLKWRYLITVICTESLKKNAFEHILETDNYDTGKFNHKIRNRIKKSLKNCSFKKPSVEEILNSGLEINKQTLHLQKRKDKTLTDIRLWDKYIRSLFAREDAEILGAYYKDRMVGYVVVLQIEGKYCFVNTFIDRKDSDVTCPMNGLIYTIVNSLIKEKGNIRISYGLETFGNPRPELSRFKRQMLFNPVPVTRVFIINPVILNIFRLIIIIYIKVLHHKSVKNRLLRKIIMLYQGNRILMDDLKKNN